MGAWFYFTICVMPLLTLGVWKNYNPGRQDKLLHRATSGGIFNSNGRLNEFL